MPYHHEAGCISRHAAMVAPLIGHDGQITALHRTYLTDDGYEADVPSVKKLTRTAGPVSAATTPLFGVSHGCMGIAAGIETALAARCVSGLPVVASYSAGTMAAWTWPLGVQRLVIFAANDAASRKDAATLQLRARRARLQCDVLSPSESGQDWADVWVAGIEAREEAWNLA